MSRFTKHYLFCFLVCFVALGANGCARAVLDSDNTPEPVTNDVAESDLGRPQPDAERPDISIDVANDTSSAEVDDFTEADGLIEGGDLVDVGEPDAADEPTDADGLTDISDSNGSDDVTDVGDSVSEDVSTETDTSVATSDLIEAGDVVSDDVGTVTLSLSVDGVNATCSGDNGSATASPSGGTAPYEYSWSNGQSSQAATGLGHGTYEATVTDANGGSASDSTSIAVSCSSACGNDNSDFIDVTPDSCPGSASDTLLWAGEYDEVFVIEGNTYTFSTCSDSDFDTQLTVYDSDGNLLAYNDDSCGLQSEIVLAPSFTDTVRVVLDQYRCVSNETFMTLVVSCE